MSSPPLAAVDPRQYTVTRGLHSQFATATYRSGRAALRTFSVFEYIPMNVCVIFNPSAKGDKARHFRAHLDDLKRSASLFATSGPGDATRLVTQALADGFQTIVAAGGDGTVNEVADGFAKAGAAAFRARMAVVPLGTMNVFARELGLPLKSAAAWQVVLNGKERLVDLPQARFTVAGQARSRAFAQMAGAGLDARAIEGVNWKWKKRTGPLAYVMSSVKAVCTRQSRIRVAGGGRSAEGELVLFGNGRLYGGNLVLFPDARLDDQLLDAAVFPKMNWFTLLRCGVSLLARRRLPEAVITRLRAPELILSSTERTPFELDGELVGILPATLSFLPQPLRVLVP